MTFDTWKEKTRNEYLKTKNALILKTLDVFINQLYLFF